MDYQRKIDFAIKLLQSIPTDDGPVEISYSGGKDSDVILELAKMAGINYEAIYKQTSIDPPGTTAHAKAMGATIIRPAKTFGQILSTNGFPSRFRRFCCGYLKEYKVRDRAVHGVRKSESKMREKRYKEPEVCRMYPHKEKVRVYYPILEWTDEDVARFISDRGLRCHPLYYDDRGQFHPERRLGCLCCPMLSLKRRQDQFKEYPRMLLMYARQGQKWLDGNGKGGKAWRMFDGDVYKMLLFSIFFENFHLYDEFVSALSGGLFSEMGGGIDAKKYLEEYFNIDLTL